MLRNMTGIMTVVVLGICGVVGVTIAMFTHSEVVAPFYEAKGSTAAVGGVTANQAVDMTTILLFGGSMVLAIPASIFLWLFVSGGNRTQRRRR
jgi:hypothetical protein